MPQKAEDSRAKELDEHFRASVLEETECMGCGKAGGHDLYVSLNGEDPAAIAAGVPGVEYAHTVDVPPFKHGMAKFDYVDE